MNLSKSLYTIGIQCPKALWLKKYKPEVLTPTDEFSQAKFDTGHTVGELACSLFPNGIKIDFNSNLEQIIKKTKELIDSGNTTIYEYTFYFRIFNCQLTILIFSLYKSYYL